MKTGALIVLLTACYNIIAIFTFTNKTNQEMTNTLTRFIAFTVLFLLPFTSMGQVQQEIAPPYNIKTASFIQNGENAYPFFRLGDSFTFVFDDLFGNEANYYYTLVHCNYDWTPSSQLTVNDYIQGFDNQRIQNYENSLNTHV